jgi:uncharacterized integral membrane protein
MNTLKKIITISAGIIFIVLLISNMGSLTIPLSITIFKNEITLQAGFWFLLFYLMGLATWMLVDLQKTMLHKRQTKILQRSIKELQAEVNSYRNLAITQDLTE